MIVRRETAADVVRTGAVVTAAFGRDLEARLVGELRADDGWLPALSLVAVSSEEVVGHVCCTRGNVDGVPGLGLGPIAVRPDRQRHGVGTALMHAVLGAADALDEPFVALLGDPAYYGRFGFVPGSSVGVAPPDDAWGVHFQVRPLSAWRPVEGVFGYATPFDRW